MYKKENKILLLDVELRYLPLEIYKYHLIKCVEDHYQKPVDYFALNLNDFFRKNKSEHFLRSRLYDLKINFKNKKTLFLSIINFPLNFFLIVLKNLWLLNFFIDDEDYKIKVLNLTGAKNSIIGDCICSYILKRQGSQGYIHKSLIQYIYIFKFLIRYTLYIGIIDDIQKKYVKKLFYSVETSYLDEAVRRYLIKRDFTEIGYDYYIGRTVQYPRLLGYEIRKGEYQRKILISNNVVLDVDQAKTKLKSLVNREIQYHYMAGMDVDVDIKLNIEKISENNAVIYLHAVSDAQYFFGPDCFIDLHDWLMKSIELLIKNDFRVFIKLHPSYFSKYHNYPVDKEYLAYLESIFDINLPNILVNKPAKTNIKNVQFISHRVSIVELKEKIPNHLCITHHGTVATEAAYLGLPVIVSSSSPYLENIDSFVDIYRSLNQYESFIMKYKSKNPGSLNNIKLYEYMAYSTFLKGFYLEKIIADCLSIDVKENLSIESERYLSFADANQVKKIDEAFHNLAVIL
jgi:hypothetical protein